MSTDVLIAETITSKPKSVEVGSCAASQTTTADALGSSESGPSGLANQQSSRTSSKGQGSGIAVKRSSIARDFVQLTKPRIVVMILVTTLMTALIGAGGLVELGQLLLLLVGTGLIAGSAGAANQVWERVIDQRMARTASRPLPDGRINTLAAVVFTLALGVGGTWILAALFGWAPALAGVATWLLYVLVYTPMKTMTSWNTTVGAIAGALPVLIGYTAMGGQFSDWTGWLLVGVLVAWQYPHFMAIAWMYRKQYDEAGFKMTTTVEPTGRSAAWQSIVGSAALIGCGVALAWIPGGLLFPVLASVGVFAATYPMLRASYRFKLSPNDQTARTLLRSSLLVLPAVLTIVTLRVFL